jgi:hypothetical protein
MTSSRATASDRAYFARIARQNPTLPGDDVPASLAEMFDRIEQIERSLGTLARPGLSGSDDGDLASHLAFLERAKEIRRREAQHAR